jgi:acyl-CoA thioesterase-2
VPGTAAKLVDLLAVCPAGAPDHFRVEPSGMFTHRIYGGEVAGQAVTASAATVAADRVVHSAHVHFLRAGDPGAPMEYLVERVRESRSLSTRLVRVEQDGRTLALATVSFQVERTGPEHQIDPDPAPAPEHLPDRAGELAALLERWPSEGPPPPQLLTAPWPVDMRYVDLAPYRRSGPVEPVNRLWLRASEPLPAEQSVHAAALVYATDMPMWEPGMYPHAASWADAVDGRAWFSSSLDHTVFLHRPFRVDEWLLMTQVNPVLAGARGMCEARLYTRDGTLVATAVQENVLTPPPGGRILP